MASLDHDHEHDSQNASNVHSECDWDWEADNWGDMDQQTTSILIPTIQPLPTVAPKPNDHWASLEEEPVSVVTFFHYKFVSFKLLSLF